MTQFFRSIAPYLKPYWLVVSFIFLGIAAQMSFKLALPFVYQLTFDKAIPNQDLKYLGFLIGIMGIWWLVQGVMAFAQDICAANTGIAAINDMRMGMFEKLQRLPIDYFDRGSTGDLMARFSIDLVALEKACIQAIYIFLFSLLNVLASLVLLFYIEWRLALMTMAGLVLSAIAPKRFSGRAKKTSYERQCEEGQLTAFVQETLGIFDMIHAFNLWGSQRNAFRKKLDHFKARAVRAYTFAALVRRIGGQSASLLQVLILGFGCYLVIQTNLTLGTLVGFLALLQILVAGTSHLTGVIPDMVQAAGAMLRVEEFLAEHQDESQKDLAELPNLNEHIAFRDIDFSYELGKPILANLSFQIPHGKSVAIVGPSGSGKSTLLKLLLRFHEPQQGAILWDGVDVKTYTKDSLRDHMSIVPQESVLFDTSLLENIRMGRLDASDEEVMDAARRAELHKVVHHLPHGYDTKVGERGSHLSGGQRQRVAIARALLRNPELLILDEATSALDPLTEKAVNQTLFRIAKNRTVISVTHKLGTAKSADHILVMVGGQVVQQGHHSTLIEEKGIYKMLWRKQTGFTISPDGFRAECSPHRLKLIPIFKSLSLDQLKHISSLLVSEFFPKQRTVFKKDDPGDKFYILVNGQVEISSIQRRDKPDESLILENGDFFGELALLDQAPRNATATTLLPTLFLTLNQFRFKKLLTQIPELEQTIQDVARDRRVQPS